MKVLDRRVGITTTIPVEALLAADLVPVDLNNVFVSHPDRESLIERAHRDGFPTNICSWIKGIYGAVISEGIQAIIAVTGGDCSNTVALAEVLADRGVHIIPFQYPQKPGRYELEQVLEPFYREFQTKPEEVEVARKKLLPIRKDLGRLDAMTWYGNRINGEENHRLLVSSSDFGGDPDKFGEDVKALLQEAKGRKPLPGEIRIGVAGVPTIFDDMFEYLESSGARVVFNEVPRQFSMPGDPADMIEQYSKYTYPYDFSLRLQDIREETRRRNCQGLIHYVQSFCHRGIEDVLLQKYSDVPVLTLEGDAPGPMDGRTRVRLEAFLEMLSTPQ